MSSSIDNKQNKNPKIALVAGEQSGDQLGASLIKYIKEIFPLAIFMGVGGEKMKKQGLNSLFPMEKLSVMGIIEPLLRISELLSLRKNLKDYLSAQNPDIFIGIDYPDFNLSVSKYLKTKGITTIQYVSPSVWAWREGRIKSIEKSVDRVLTLFPFEKEAYKNSSVEVTFVGHPLAHKFSKDLNKEDIRKKKFSVNEGKMIALLPGSRRSEISKMGVVLLKTAELIKDYDDNARFFMPFINLNHREIIRGHENYSWVNFSEGNSQEVLAASHIGIVTSGTASLEAALLRTPVVVAYKTSWLTYSLVKPLLKINHFALPNLLSEEVVLPELIQKEVTATNLFDAYKDLEGNNYHKSLEAFEKIHLKLMANGPDTAAKVIAEML